MARDQPADRRRRKPTGEHEPTEVKVELEGTGLGDTLEAELERTVGRVLEDELGWAIERMLRAWRKQTVLVLGFTGVGKTSLLRFMFGAQVQRDQPTTRATEYIFNVAKTKFKAVDTPGHPTFKELLDSEIDSLLRGAYDGVINVTAYGYSQPAHGQSLRKEDNPYTPVFRGGRPNTKYLERTRELEIEYMEAWARLLDPRAKLKWILTVVNKRDLWMSSEDAVAEHYGPAGAYGGNLRSLIQNIPHSVLHMISEDSGQFFDMKRKRNPDAQQRRDFEQRFARVLHARLSGKKLPT